MTDDANGNQQTKENRVLLVTHSQDDLTAGLAQKALAKHGAEGVIFNTDLYPTNLMLSSMQHDACFNSSIRVDQKHVNLNEFTSVWYRRMHAAHKLPAEMSAPFREAAAEESRRTLIGLLATIPCFVLDPFQTVRRAACKMQQLTNAHRVGLKTPRTLVTNDAATAKEFVDSCPAGVIAKLQSAVGIPMDDGLNAVPTTRIMPKHYEALEALKYCPMMFQACIEKKLELRIAVVGRQSFAAAIDSSQLPNGKVDWRVDAHDAVKLWSPFKLPAEINQKVHQFMDIYGLNYGGIDIIVTPEDDYIFLEVNPGGEFHWLDHSTGLPIADALASVLLNRVPRRLSAEQHPAVKS